jgi:hemolysin III
VKRTVVIVYRGERINSISHLVGASLAFPGMIVLIVFSALSEDPWKLAGGLVYGVTLLMLFVFSTLFHSLQGTAKLVFQRFDHIAIYWLIAGTYTPYCLVTLRQDRGWLLFGIVWGVALVGTVFKSIFGPRFQAVSTALYVACGWTILLDLSALRVQLAPAGLAWLFAGGVLYTVGAVFFMSRGLPRNHEIWHFFVLAAAVCHYVSVLFYVVS